MKRITLHSNAIVMTISLLSAVFCRAGQSSSLATNLESGNRPVVVAYGTSLTENEAWVQQMKGIMEALGLHDATEDPAGGNSSLRT